MAESTSAAPMGHNAPAPAPLYRWRMGPEVDREIKLRREPELPLDWPEVGRWDYLSKRIRGAQDCVCGNCGSIRRLG